MKFFLLAMLLGFGVASTVPLGETSVKSSIIQNHPLREETSPLNAKKNAQIQKAMKNYPSKYCIYEDTTWSFRQQSKVPKP